MDIVLGVSMTPSAVRMVLVEGENADGASVDHDTFEIASDGASAISGAPQQVVDAILGTQESAVEGGHRLTSVGIAWTDHADAARLRQRLSRHRLHDVVLVSELHAASALTQAIGQSVGYRRTALLLIERDTATLAVVRTGDGAVVRVVSRRLAAGDSVTELKGMVAGLDVGEEAAQAVFIVGSGVDVAALEPQIATATSLPVQAPADGDLALARGAALAAAGTARYEASTVGMTSSQDTEAGLTQMAAAGYMAPLGYSAVPDEIDDDLLGYDGPAIEAPAEQSSSKPFVLLGSALSTIFVIGVAALAVSLAVVIRPAVDQRAQPGGNPVVSSTPAPVPAQAKDVAPPAAPETIQAPVPVVREAPRTVVVAPPAARAPAPATAPAPAAAPAAPPPAPAPAAELAPAPPPAPAPAPAPAAPVPNTAPAPAAPPIVLPVPIVLPPIFQAPVRTLPVPRTPRTPPTAAAYPSTDPTPTYSSVPSQPSYPTSTPPVTTYPAYPSNPPPSAAAQAPGSQAPSAGSGSSNGGSGSADSGSGDSGSSTRSRNPLWPMWPFGG